MTDIALRGTVHSGSHMWCVFINECEQCRVLPSTYLRLRCMCWCVVNEQYLESAVLLFTCGVNEQQFIHSTLLCTYPKSMYGTELEHFPRVDADRRPCCASLGTRVANARMWAPLRIGPLDFGSSSYVRLAFTASPLRVGSRQRCPGGRASGHVLPV